MWSQSETKVKSMWNQREINVKSNWNQRETKVKSMWNQCEINVKSMWNQIETNVKSMWNQCEVKVTSMWNQCYINAKSNWNRCETKVKSMWNQSEIKVNSTWTHSEIKVNLKWTRSAIKVKSKWRPPSPTPSFLASCNSLAAFTSPENHDVAAEIRIHPRLRHFCRERLPWRTDGGTRKKPRVEPKPLRVWWSGASWGGPVRHSGEWLFDPIQKSTVVIFTPKPFFPRQI